MGYAFIVLLEGATFLPNCARLSLPLEVGFDRLAAGSIAFDFKVGLLGVVGIPFLHFFLLIRLNSPSF
jgi:hypothetical protein